MISSSSKSELHGLHCIILFLWGPMRYLYDLSSVSAMACPANSQYKLCASTCAISCAGITGKMTCMLTCAEGCECNAGYRLDGDRCVEANSCGCFEKGRYYKVYILHCLHNVDTKYWSLHMVDCLANCQLIELNYLQN